MRLLNRILDMIYPRRCPICHDIIPDKGELCCKKCEDKPILVKDPFCIKCGKPLLSSDKVLCCDCKNSNRYFTEGRAVFLYDDVMRKSIYRFKYGGRREYAKYYANQIIKQHKSRIDRWKPQVIIPIPLHKSKQKKRGYNQAQLIAKELSNLTKIPIDNRVLLRTKKTDIQKNLGAKTRESNLKNAFKMRPNRVQYLSAMLIDDIYTTGSTMSNASKVLKEGGIRQIYCMSLCIGRDIEEDTL